MKKIILILALMISIHMESKAQQGKQFTASVENNTFSMYSSANNFPDKDADFYFRRSKSQRTVGWVTLGAGVVLSGIGLLVATNNQGATYDQYGNYSEDDNTTIAAVLLITGGLSGIVSIPFMIMASGNKHKARLMLKNQQTGFGIPPGMNKNITGISMVFSFGK
jgi:hypothetical protein